jgi:hypothetical protein
MVENYKMRKKISPATGSILCPIDIKKGRIRKSGRERDEKTAFVKRTDSRCGVSPLIICAMMSEVGVL